MKDIAGNEIKLGDTVAVHTGGKSPYFSLKTVVGFTDQFVKVGNTVANHNRRPYHLAVVIPPKPTFG